MAASLWSYEMDRLQDRISRGLGAAARVLGVMTDAYRPASTCDPLASSNRFLRLHSAFSLDDSFAKAASYGNALWQGTFNSAYTRPGDYLVQEAGTYRQLRASRGCSRLCASRPIGPYPSPERPAPTSHGVSGYGGATPDTAVPLLSRWPASVTGATGGGRPEAGLPGDTATPYWTVLVPACSDVVLRPSDIMTDDLGRTATVSAAELTELGWRITVKQALT